MAIYHFSAQVISRNQGRSSVAAAAYRSAEKLIDERLGQVHDFIRKNDVLDKTILLPAGAPSSFVHRGTLWNAVELCEKRKDAQVAREINIALPRELSSSENWSLLTSFVQSEFVDRGMIADVAFHRGHRGGEEQPHGHVLLTLREVSSAGFGQKVRAWNDRSLLSDWREHWAEHCNRALALSGFDLRIDHRTLDAQGIPLEPQRKIGPEGMRVGQVRLGEHQVLSQRNGERLLAEPEIALRALTRSHSTFSHQDLARFVSRHTVDGEQFSFVYEKIKSHADLVVLGRDAQGRERLTTQEMLALETKMIEHATGFAAVANHVCSSKHDARVDSNRMGGGEQAASSGEKISDLEVEKLIAPAQSRSLSAEQHVAFEHLMRSGDLACVVGYAGTGKSYLLGEARQAWEASGYRVVGMTLSGIAAENLESGSGISSFTVASRLWHWERDRERLGPLDIVVVDEAGMLGSRALARILEEAHSARSKVVLVGDPEQLQAIEAGAAFRAIAERVGFVELTEIRRQREAWQQEATRDFARERTREGLLAYERHDNLHAFETSVAAMKGMVEQWDEVRSQSPEKSQLMLAYTRAQVAQLNEEARAIRRAGGELGDDQLVETSRGERSFAEGDRVYFLRNERSLGVKNGTLGTIEVLREHRFKIALDRVEGQAARSVEFDLKDYCDVDHGYAATVYKAQGVTVDRSHVLASPYFDRHSTYVAMSRHREGVDLYVSREDFMNFNRLEQTLSRERTKDVTLDYAQERGLAVKEEIQLQDRDIRRDSVYRPPLSEERFKQAEQRLAQRYNEALMKKEIGVWEEKLGVKLDRSFAAGDQGIYAGSVELVGRRYGILHQAEGQAKLIPFDKLESRERGEKMVIQAQKTDQGLELLKAIQPKVREREKVRALERERGGFEIGD